MVKLCRPKWAGQLARIGKTMQRERPSLRLQKSLDQDTQNLGVLNWMTSANNWLNETQIGSPASILALTF